MDADTAATTARALWYAARNRAELRSCPLPAPTVDDVLVRTLWSGISRGTERLVFDGRVPPSEAATMRAPMQDGAFPFPVKYGYSAVGLIEDGRDDLGGRAVFVLYPHQERFVVPATAVVPIPGDVPPRRAILAANMETALNALWDSGAGPGARIVVIGAGVVGLLVTFVAARLPGATVTVCDIAPDRRAIAETFGAAFVLPDSIPGDAHIVFHTSATAAGLASAIGCAGFEARIVEMSWYGEGTIPVPLGGAFHSRRLQLISSQVSHVAPSHRATWTHRRRLEEALSLLADGRLDALITSEVPFSELPAALPRILGAGAAGLATAIRYA
jgi:2-desacetyl-2-hydroxyethyl bacteriochlorophyllide A dehydrogenase